MFKKCVLTTMSIAKILHQSNAFTDPPEVYIRLMSVLRLLIYCKCLSRFTWVSLFCYAFRSVLSSFVIILARKRELDDLL